MSCLTRLNTMGAMLIGTVLVSACTPQVRTTGPTTPTQPTTGTTAQVQTTADQPIKLAMLVPVSASQQSAAQLGQALANAARLAVTEAGDPLLSIEVYDTAGDPGKARAMAEKALQEDAKLFIGPLLGTSTRAVAAPAARAGVKVISFSTDTSVAGDPVYLSGFIPEVAARRVVSYARARGYGQLGVFYPETAYGQQAVKGAEAAGAGRIVVSTGYARTNEGIPPAAEAFAAEARAAGAQAVLLAESGQALKFVGALLQNYGLQPDEVKYLGLGEWNSRATLGEASLEGGWFAAPDPTAMRAFIEKYEAAYGTIPPSLAVLGYDAAKIAAELVADARARKIEDPFNTAALTRGRGFRGAVGPIRFDADGIGARGMAILEVGTGVFETIDPVPGGVGS